MQWSRCCLAHHLHTNPHLWHSIYTHAASSGIAVKSQQLSWQKLKVWVSQASSLCLLYLPPVCPSPIAPVKKWELSFCPILKQEAMAEFKQSTESQDQTSQGERSSGFRILMSQSRINEILQRAWHLAWMIYVNYLTFFDQAMISCDSEVNMFSFIYINVK